MTEFVAAVEVQEWLDDFPDHAMRALEMADLSLIKEWERQRALNPDHHVRIWSLDGGLAGYG